MFRYFNQFGELEPNELDVLICDEADWIRETSANRYNRAGARTGTAQVEELLRVARADQRGLLLAVERLARWRPAHPRECSRRPAAPGRRREPEGAAAGGGRRHGPSRVWKSAAYWPGVVPPV